MKKQLLAAAKYFKAFSIALYKSTNVSGTAQCAVFIRGVNCDFRYISSHSTPVNSNPVTYILKLIRKLWSFIHPEVVDKDHNPNPKTNPFSRWNAPEWNVPVTVNCSLNITEEFLDLIPIKGTSLQLNVTYFNPWKAVLNLVKTWLAVNYGHVPVMCPSYVDVVGLVKTNETAMKAMESILSV